MNAGHQCMWPRLWAAGSSAQMQRTDPAEVWEDTLRWSKESLGRKPCSVLRGFGDTQRWSEGPVADWRTAVTMIMPRHPSGHKWPACPRSCSSTRNTCDNVWFIWLHYICSTQKYSRTAMKKLLLSKIPAIVGLTLGLVQLATAQPDLSMNWCSHFGGPSLDYGLCTTVDEMGHIYISGNTLSETSIASALSYQTVYGGNNDGYIAKFNESGQRLWSTYFGGDDEEIIYDINSDNSGSIVVVGTTKSTTGIATTGAHQTSFSGNVDSFIAKFDENGNLLWSTYFGGSAYDKATGVDFLPDGRLVVVGWTTSNSGIATPGAFREYQLGQDGYLACFASNGALIWSTYFGGSGPAQEEARCIVVDDENGIYVGGFTEATSLLATPGAHQVTYGGGQPDGDGFLAHFNDSGLMTWASYYGGAGNDYVNSIARGNNNELVIGGSTNSNSSIATAGAHQTSLLGNALDAFLAVFNTSGQRQWSTYLGGNSSEEGRSVSIVNNNIYFSGLAQSSGLSTPNALYSSGGGGFIAKFGITGIRQSFTYFHTVNKMDINTSGTLSVVSTTTSGVSDDYITSGVYQVNHNGGVFDGILASLNSQSELSATNDSPVNMFEIFPNPILPQSILTIHSPNVAIIGVAIENELGQSLLTLNTDNLGLSKNLISFQSSIMSPSVYIVRIKTIQGELRSKVLCAQ